MQLARPEQPAAPEVVPVIRGVQRLPESVPPSVRSELEPRLGASLDDVEVHRGPEAGAAAAAGRRPARPLVPRLSDGRVGSACPDPGSVRGGGRATAWRAGGGAGFRMFWAAERWSGGQAYCPYPLCCFNQCCHREGAVGRVCPAKPSPAIGAGRHPCCAQRAPHGRGPSCAPPLTEKDGGHRRARHTGPAPRQRCSPAPQKSPMVHPGGPTRVARPRPHHPLTPPSPPPPAAASLAG